jgi:hypothetical protein
MAYDINTHSLMQIMQLIRNNAKERAAEPFSPTTELQRAEAQQIWHATEVALAVLDGGYRPPKDAIAAAQAVIDQWSS